MKNMKNNMNNTGVLAGTCQQGGALLPSACCIQDAAVDEVGTLSRWNGIEYGHDFLGGVEEACLGVLLLASCPLAGTAPVLTFQLILFHSSGIICIFAGEKAEVGEVSLPVWCQIQISNLILTFQTLSEIATLIRLQSFRFFLLFSRFSDASVCLSLTIQRYEIYLILPNFFKIIFKSTCIFFEGK